MENHSPHNDIVTFYVQPAKQDNPHKRPRFVRPNRSRWNRIIARQNQWCSSQIVSAGTADEQSPKTRHPDTADLLVQARAEVSRLQNDCIRRSAEQMTIGMPSSPAIPSRVESGRQSVNEAVESMIDSAQM